MSTEPAGSAVLSACGTYRYRLERTWAANLGTCVFVMLNPSTADASVDDPTIRRCVGFAKAWGYGRLVVGNLYALRATNPKMLWTVLDPVGPANREHLRRMAAEADLIVCAWGAHGARNGRGRMVRSALLAAAPLNVDVMALGHTRAGEPVHPLYQPKAAQLVPA